MFGLDIVSYQFAQAEKVWIANEKREEAIEKIADDIYTKLLNGKVVCVDNRQYSLDDVIEEMYSKPTFATIVMTSLTFENEAGHDLANTAREEAEKLAKTLAEELYEDQCEDVY